MLELEFAMEVRVRLGERYHIPTSTHTRGTVIVQEGTFEGPRIKGIVVPQTGGDHPVIGADGTARFDATYLLQADDGTLIFKRNYGMRSGPPEVLKRLLAKEQVDPSEYYMRLSPSFEVPPGPHDWLSKHIFIGTGRRGPEGSIFRYWMVK